MSGATGRCGGDVDGVIVGRYRLDPRPSNFGSATDVRTRRDLGTCMLAFEVPEPTISLNRLQRLHWHAKRRIRDGYEQIIRIRMSVADRARPGELRRVRIDRYSAGQLDNDNFVGGCKPLLDALQRVGVLWDDSPEFVQVEYVQHKSKRADGRTIVTVF